jgi:hypothetical protein
LNADSVVFTQGALKVTTEWLAANTVKPTKISSNEEAK